MARRIDDYGQPVRMRHLDHGFERRYAGDRPLQRHEVVHRRRLRADRRFELLRRQALRVPCFDDAGAGNAEQAVVFLARALLDDDLVGDVLALRQALQVFAVLERQAGRNRERQGRSGAGW